MPDHTVRQLRLATVLALTALAAGPIVALAQAPNPEALPDLVVSEIAFDHVSSFKDAEGRTCYSFRYGYTVKNQGQAAAAGCSANVEFLAQNTGQYVHFAADGVGPLAAGASFTRTSQPAMSQIWCFGSPHPAKVRVTVDPAAWAPPRGSVLESREDNNSREREFRTVAKVKTPVAVPR